MIIAVCGNLGSGKTTIANYIASHYNFVYIPYSRNELNFIEDFFDAIPEKFLQTQTSFLISKASQIKELLKEKKNIVIDRSLIEDIHIFAQNWIDNCSIESRIVTLYHDIATYIYSSLPEPDVHVLCNCSIEKSKKGILNRPSRSFENKYPENHIENLHSYYENLSFSKDTTTIAIDTENLEFEDFNITKQVVEEIFSCIETINQEIDNKDIQLSFFEHQLSSNQEGTIKGKSFIKYVEYSEKKISLFNFKDILNLKVVYLAAPFTNLASEKRSVKNENRLFVHDLPYGVLPKSYQKKLLAIKKEIKTKWNYETLLPHQDINNWGKKELSASSVMQSITDGLNAASVVLAIPGESIGVHFEIGYALSQNKKIIIFEVSELKNSFFVKGFIGLNNTKVISVKSINQIKYELGKPEILGFLNR